MKRPPSDCDVVVIGGGPSGSTAATLLAQKGYQVVLLEKETFPRPHVGESLIPYFWRCCDATGVSGRVEEENFVRKSGGIVVWQDIARKTSFSQFGFNKPALHVERDVFDKILLDHARANGVQVFENIRANSLGGGAGPATVEYSFSNSGDKQVQKDCISAKYVVDCSGQNALTATQHNFREFDTEFRFVGLWAYYRDSNYLDYQENVQPFAKVQEIPPVTTISSIGEWGWGWHIPLRRQTSVGLVLEKQEFQALKKANPDLKHLFQSVVERTPVFNRLLRDATLVTGKINAIKDYSYKPTKLYHDNCFICGDAAAFVDPINSAGVTFGMYGSYMAAWAIDNALKNPDKLAYYQGIFDKFYRGRLDIFRLIAFPDNSREINEFLLGSEMLKMHSDTDIKLILSAAAMTSRSRGIEKLLAASGIEHDERHFVEDVSLAI